MTESVENIENEKRPEVVNEWIIRKCFLYDDEYQDCTSVKARFNQLFIFGKTLDCSQWKRDSVNCYKWNDEHDIKAANELIQSEMNRRKDRLLPHYKNDVWTKRKEPPENWNTPLPEYLAKEYEGTYLYLKSREMRGEIPPSFDPNVKFCTIL